MSNDDFKKDPELDQLLAPFKNLRATNRQLQSWQSVAATQNLASYLKPFIQMAVAASIGFLIATAFYKHGVSSTNNFDSDATIETVYVKGP